MQRILKATDDILFLDATTAETQTLNREVRYRATKITREIVRLSRFDGDPVMNISVADLQRNLGRFTLINPQTGEEV